MGDFYAIKKRLTDDCFSNQAEGAKSSQLFIGVGHCPCVPLYSSVLGIRPDDIIEPGQGEYVLN